MSAYADVYIKLEVLETLAKTLISKGEKGIKLTLSIQDESDKFGQNVSIYVSQSKEEQEAKKPKYYVGNGRVYWENGIIKKGVRQEDTPPQKTGTY